MSRKLFLNVAGLILSTTVIGLILVPLTLVALPFVMVRPSMVTPLYTIASQKIMEQGAQVMIKSMRRGR